MEGLASGYGAIEVLHGISLEVLPGEVVAIIGPNGAGKSTLLNTLSGLIRPSHGRIAFDGSDITNMRAERIVARGLVQCPEGRRIFQRLTIRENLLTGFIPGRGRTQAQALEMAFSLFPLLGERQREKASRLSGGQQQMLAIGRSLMATPRLLMLDEPSLGLAPKAVETVFAQVERLAAAGTAILLVEQQVGLALDVSDYAYGLANGRLQVEGGSPQLRRDAGIGRLYLGHAGGEAGVP